MGVRIARLRLQLGLTQAELGQRVHVSASTIGMYEQGRRMPSVDILDALAQELGVPIDYLVRGYPCPHSVAAGHLASATVPAAEFNEIIEWIHHREFLAAICALLLNS